MVQTQKGGNMSAILKDLVKQVDSRDIKLVAGKKGILNPVEWVHMVDNTEIADFLSGGEVAFTTGIGINKDMTLMDLVERVYKNNASGMVINVGPYVPEITEEVLEFGNKHDFPIFEVPWNVHMANIMRMFCFTIMQSEQRAMELSAAFKYAIFTPKQEELYVSVLMQKGYFTDWNYVVSILEICDHLEKENEEVFYAPISKERLQMFEKKAMREITQDKHDAVVFSDNNRIVIVLSDIKEKEAYKYIDNVKTRIISLMKSTEAIFTGIGSTASGFRRLYKSYMMAKKVVDWYKVECVEDETGTYESMGINRLLFNIDDTDSLEEYYNDTIKPLDEYDSMNGSNLVEVLECYMKHNGSVQDAAEELFVHRNTVNYKIKKIESLLNVNITRFEVRNELALGLMVAKLRKFSK